MRKAFLGFVLAAAAWGQKPAAPRFEVVSIKPSPDLASQVQSGKLHTGIRVDGALVDIGALSLADLMRTAYRVKPWQISGPDWMAGSRFDIQARIPEGVSKDQVPEMLQNVLAERFNLSIHRETKDLKVYALIVGKDGAKMKKSQPENDAASVTGGAHADLGSGPVNLKTDTKGGTTVLGGAYGAMRLSPGTDGATRYEFTAISMNGLADFLSPLLDRPVLDMTELKGDFQAALEIPFAILQRRSQAAGFPTPAVPNSDPSEAPLVESVQKMGLKLEARKAPVETIVVDHVEKTPTAN